MTKKNKIAEESLKEIEKALFAIRFYPVAVDEKAKKDAVKKLIKIHNSGDDTVRQLLLYMVHETIAKTAEFRVMHTHEYMKMKNADKDPSHVRMGVYRAIFNYNTSIEGACELYYLLGKLNKDDAAKLLTYHYTRLCTMENEVNHMLRAAIIRSLGESDSIYALNALLEYVKIVDSDRSIKSIISALSKWNEKIDKMKLGAKEKEKIKERLQDTMTEETGGRHYG